MDLTTQTSNIYVTPASSREPKPFNDNSDSRNPRYFPIPNLNPSTPNTLAYSIQPALLDLHSPSRISSFISTIPVVSRHLVLPILDRSLTSYLRHLDREWKMKYAKRMLVGRRRRGQGQGGNGDQSSQNEMKDRKDIEVLKEVRERVRQQILGKTTDKLSD